MAQSPVVRGTKEILEVKQTLMHEIQAVFSIGNMVVILYFLELSFRELRGESDCR